MESSTDDQIRILIVDDQEILRVGLRYTLEKTTEFNIVGEAEDGEIAVRKCQTLKPHIVLMDLGMPVKDGIDATNEIKNALPEIRIIILTSHDSDQDIFAALGAGADGYCIKAITKDQLIGAIKSVFQGAAWLDPAIAKRVLKASVIPQQHIEKPGKGNACDLSSRELEVLNLLVDGLSNQEMANRLIVSVETIKTHMRHIMEKLVVSDRTQAAVRAMKLGLVSSK